MSLRTLDVQLVERKIGFCELIVNMKKTVRMIHFLVSDVKNWIIGNPPGGYESSRI